MLVVPGGSRPVEPDRPPRLEDIKATAVALSGESTAGMVGQPLLERWSPSRCGQTRRRRVRTASVAIPYAVATWASTTSAPTTAPWAKPARTSPM